MAERRSAARAARSGARDGPHAPDPRASLAPRLSARRRRQVRRLRVEQGARAAGLEADVPACVAHPLRASGRRPRGRRRGAAAAGARCVRRASRCASMADPASFVPRRFRFVVFDWDGTLADSTAIIAGALQQACRDVGEPVPADSDARFVIGLGLADALRHVAPGLPATRHARSRRALSVPLPRAGFGDTALRGRAGDARRPRRSGLPARRRHRQVARRPRSRARATGRRAFVHGDALRRRGLRQAASRHAARA